jgi:Cu/Ag efflux pump CusA
MTRWLASMLRFRALVVAIAAGLLVAGVAHLRKAPVDVLPEYTQPYVQVQTEALGLSAAEVEQLMTVPLEQDLLNGVKGVDTIRSDSIPGLSSITMFFERGTDILRARQLVSERLSQPHAFPTVGSAPQMIQPVSSTSRVMMITLSSRTLSPVELSVLARWTVRPRLMGIPGVSNVAIWGHRDRELEVLVDPARLRQNRVSLLQVVRTAGNAQLVSPLSFLNASTPGTGGFLDGPNQRLGVRHILPFAGPRDLAQVPVEGSRSQQRLGDVANVIEDHPPLIGDAVAPGVGPDDALQLVVEKLPGTNTLALTHRLDDALREMAPGLAGVRIDTSPFRPAGFIETGLDHLRLAALVAAALVALVLFAFLMQWRAAVICLVAIPLSLVVALLVLDLTGATMNALVVAGLVVALGAVVDDAVGDVQGMARALEEARGGSGAPEAGNGHPARSPARIVLASAGRTRSAMGYATLIVLLLMLPVFLTGGLTGAFLHPLALSYALAVIASMAVALTVTPALGLLLYLRPPRAGSPQPLARRAAAAATAGLSRAIRSPRPALMTFAGFLVVGLALLPFLGQALRPTFKDRELVVHWDATASTSLPEMYRITSRAAAEVRALPGVREVGAHIGRAITSDQTAGSGSGEMWVTMKPSADYDRTLTAVRGVVAGYPGVRSSVLTYEGDRMQGVLAPADRGLTVRVFGQDLAVLDRQAAAVRRTVAQVDGVRGAHVRPTPVQPTLQIEVDLAAALRHGIKPGDVRRAAAVLVEGLDVGAFFEQQKVFQVVVRGAPNVRDSVDAVRNLRIDAPDGTQVRLGDVARVAIAPNPVDIRHEAVSRYVDVRAAIRGRGVAAVRADVRDRLRAMHLPLDYHAEVVTPVADEGSPLSSFLALAAAAAVGIYLLLQAAFGSWRLATLLFLTLPVALVGGVLVIVAGGGEVSLGAAFGLMTVLGIAVRNGVMLIRHLQELRNGDPERLDAALVVRGTVDRAAPVALTALVTAAALAPFAVLGDVAGNEITHSTAAVVIGGLVTSTVLSLFVLPALYLHFARGAVPARAERGDRATAADLDLLPGT